MKRNETRGSRVQKMVGIEGIEELIVEIYISVKFMYLYVWASTSTISDISAKRLTLTPMYSSLYVHVFQDGSSNLPHMSDSSTKSPVPIPILIP